MPKPGRSDVNSATPNPASASSLKPRYEIRKLEPNHLPWSTAIVIHSNLFHSPVWPVLYPNSITENVRKSFIAASYLVDHQINSGFSYGVFDTKYDFKRPDSHKTGGKLYWSEDEPSIQGTEGLEAESKRLLEQMDFPLVSVALSYDVFDALDLAKMEPIMACLSHFGLIYHVLDMLDARSPNPSKPIARGQILYRNATATRHDYEGEGIMAGMARWLMREADTKDFRGIQIECLHDAVKCVWSKPPLPYKGHVVASFRPELWEDDKGQRPFLPANQECAKVFVQLKKPSL